MALNADGGYMCSMQAKELNRVTSPRTLLVQRKQFELRGFSFLRERGILHSYPSSHMKLNYLFIYLDLDLSPHQEQKNEAEFHSIEPDS